MTLETEAIVVEKLGSSERDTNDVLQEQGIYRLADVCRFLYFKPDQLRNQAKRCPDPKKVMGVYFHEPEGAYLVDMPVFSKWIADLWLGPITDSHDAS